LLEVLNLKNEKEPVRKYYTKENPSGPWSRALYQMRNGKPFNEEEFKKDFEEGQKKLRELMDEDNCTE
jgi:hypothetical protein